MPRRNWNWEEWGPSVESDGAWLPSYFPVTIEKYDGVTDLRIGIALIDDKWQPVELSFVNPNNTALDGGLLDRVVRLLPKLVKAQVLTLETMPITSDGKPMRAEDSEDFRRATIQRQRRQVLTDDFLQSVAYVYSSAPSKPAKAVQEWAPTTPATASRWIKAARDRGFLKPKGEA